MGIKARLLSRTEGVRMRALIRLNHYVRLLEEVATEDATRVYVVLTPFGRRVAGWLGFEIHTVSEAEVAALRGLGTGTRAQS